MLRNQIDHWNQGREGGISHNRNGIRKVGGLIVFAGVGPLKLSNLRLEINCHLRRVSGRIITDMVGVDEYNSFHMIGMAKRV